MSFLSILREFGIESILRILDAVQRFLAGEEVVVYVTLRNGVRLRVTVDLNPPSLRIERI
ncbi:MAG: hypothetical protein QN135_10705 [Armatimonadota bacterium]|nr:hypothetical protein [Armatimonadota bacterium]